MSDFWAGVQIWMQNFNARYGVAALVCLGVLVLALFMYTIIKTVIAGQSKERKVQLRARMADEKIRLRAAESLADMISYQTTSDDRNELKRLISYIKKRYPRLFAEAKIENSDCGLLFCLKAKNSRKKPLLFCGHLDVVPAGEGWKHPPFGGKSDGGKIYGRGACDCKGPVTAMLEAIESLLCEGDRPQRDLWFAFGGDEETGGEQGAAVFAELLEKKGVTFDLILDEGGYIAKSHSDSKDFPIALIGIGEKQSCYFTLKASGQGGHSGMPRGRTALGALAEAVCRIEMIGNKKKLTPMAKRFLVQSMPAMSFSKRYLVANMPFTSPFVKKAFANDFEVSSLMGSTLVPTRVQGSDADNMLVSTAECVVNAQLMPSQSAEKTLAFLKRLLVDLDIEVTMSGATEKVKLTSTDSEMYKTLCEVLKERYPGIPCLEWISSGCSDAAHYGNFSDSILYFTPIVMEKKTAFSAHGAEERISEESLGAAVEIYKKLMVI